jgi:hypothetical protein
MLDRIQLRAHLGFAVAIDGAYAGCYHCHDFRVERLDPVPEVTLPQGAENFPRNVPIHIGGLQAWLFVARESFRFNN